MEGRTPLRDLLLFDFSERKWIQAEKPPKGIFGHSANVFGKEMIVFGGCDGRMLLKDLRILDFETMRYWFLKKILNGNREKAGRKERVKGK